MLFNMLTTAPCPEMHQMLIRTHEKERCVVDAVVLLCAVRAGAGQGMGRGAWAGVRQGKQKPTMMWGIAIGWLFLLRKLQSIKITTKVRICKLNEIPYAACPGDLPRGVHEAYVYSQVSARISAKGHRICDLFSKST